MGAFDWLRDRKWSVDQEERQVLASYCNSYQGLCDEFTTLARKILDS
jgi:hypothetical protein